MGRLGAETKREMQQPATSGHLIYVVDDDAAIGRLVSVNLEARGYRVRQFEHASAALAALGTNEPDLIILGLAVNSPGGLEAVSQIRRLSGVPIMVMSVRHETLAKLAALEAGADDYITKPFLMDEVLVRTRAILRRTSPDLAEPIRNVYSYRSGELRVDLPGTRVTLGGEAVHLTGREWAMLKVLVQNAGRVVSSQQLLQEAWGPDYGSEGDYVRAYIARLRRKLEPDPRSPQFILLERGLGYRLKPGDENVKPA